MPNILDISLLVLQHDLTNIIQASLQIEGKEYHKGKPYSFPLVALALNSNFTAINSSSLNSDMTFKVSSFIRDSFFRERIKDFFSVFLVDKASPICYIKYVLLMLCFV